MQVVEFFQHRRHRKISSFRPRLQPGDEIGAACQRLHGIEGRLAHERGQSRKQGVQRVAAPRAALGIEHREPGPAQPVLQDRRHLGVGYADREQTFRRAVTPGQRRHPRRLLRRVRTEVHLRGKIRQRQRPTPPRRLARPAPLVKQRRRLRLVRAADHDVHRPRLRPQREHAHRQGQRIGRAEQHDLRHPRRDHGRPRQIDLPGLGVAPAADRQRAVVAPFQFGELLPSLDFRQPRAGPRDDVAHPQSIFAQRGLQPLELSRQPRGPGKVPRRGIDRKHRAEFLQIRGAQHLRPRQLRFQPRRDGHAARVRRRRHHVLRQHDARRQHGRVANRGVFGQRLAQSSARLPRGHHHQPGRKVERPGSIPVAGQPGRRLRGQRPVPRQENLAKVGGRSHGANFVRLPGSGQAPSGGGQQKAPRR